MDGKDIVCTICLNILFKPVVLPCKHEFCKSCLLNAMDHTSYQCPICRYRLSNWLRKIKDIDSVICESDEKHLRSLFPNYYKAKDVGESPMLSKSEIQKYKLCTQNRNVRNILSKPGDVYADYLKECENYSKLRLLEEKDNEEASIALAAQLLAEDSFNMSGDILESRGLDRVAPSQNTDRQATVSSRSIRGSNTRNTKRSNSISSSNSCLAVSKKVENTRPKRVTSKPCKSILDYTVRKGNSYIKPNRAVSEQIARDEKLARKLQAQL